MNSVLSRVMDDSTPKINTKITDGTARAVLSTIPMYLDEFFRSGLKSLNPKIDFKYLGFRRISPKEEYNNMVLSRVGTVQYDLSHNNVCVTEFRFEYAGCVITRPIYLPYASRGNIMVMGGANYHITPVLSDTVISPSESGVFVRLFKAKLNFKSRARYFMVNNERVAGNIIYGEILKPNHQQLTDHIGRPLPTTSLYLLGKYGLVESLKKYGNVTDVIVTSDQLFIPPEGYTVYESIKTKPRGLKAVPYIPHNVKICVCGNDMDIAYVNNLIFGTIYAVDILPEIEDDVVGLVSSGDVKLEISFWRIILGRIIYKNSFSVDRIAQDLDSHFIALEGYVDLIIQAKLAEVSIYVDDFFDLVALLIGKYNTWVLTNKEYNSNIENRYIDILYYLTYDIIIGFNRAILSLNKRITKTANIGYKEVAKILSNELGSKRVYSLTKSTEPNLAITSVDYTGDIFYPKITAILEDLIGLLYIYRICA